MEHKISRHLFSHLLLYESPQSQNSQAVSTEQQIQMLHRGRNSTPGNSPASTCWQRCLPSVKAVTVHCPLTPPDTCVLPAAHLWQAGSRTIGAWPTRPLVVAAKGPGSQGPNNAMPSALDFMPLLQALLGKSLNCKATNTPVTLTGEPLLSCLILPTFWCKRCCWLRPAFPQRWEQERLSWGQNEEPWGPAELLSSWGAWGVCFRGHMPLMSSLLPQGAIAKT